MKVIQKIEYKHEKTTQYKKGLLLAKNIGIYLDNTAGQYYSQAGAPK